MATQTLDRKTATVAEDEENPLKVLLEETGIGQRELARLLGMSGHATISDRVNGKAKLSPELATLYGVLIGLHRSGKDVRDLLKKEKN